MRYKIQLINALGEVVDENVEPLQAEEAIRLIKAYESVISKAAQQSVQPTVLTARHKLVTCPQCLLVFDGNEHTTHSG